MNLEQKIKFKKKKGMKKWKKDITAFIGWSLQQKPPEDWSSPCVGETRSSGPITGSLRRPAPSASTASSGGRPVSFGS